MYFGALWGVVGIRLGALMAFNTLLVRRLTLEPSTTPAKGQRMDCVTKNPSSGFWDIRARGLAEDF